jgi:hypothetical protein
MTADLAGALSVRQSADFGAEPSPHNVARTDCADQAFPPKKRLGKTVNWGYADHSLAIRTQLVTHGNGTHLW